MKRTYPVKGMRCSGCEATVATHLQQLPSVTKAVAKVKESVVEVAMDVPLPLAVLQNALPKKYTLSDPIEVSAITHKEYDTTTKWQQLKPLFLILFYIAVSSALLHYQAWDWNAFMLDFMGLFLIVFSFFKMLDLKGFPASFAMYDPLAKAIPFYGWVYPFLETALGLLFLMRFTISLALIVTVVVLSITTIGVTRMLLSKHTIRCACLGTALKLPMTEATFIENTLMIAMAVFMLLQ